MILLSGVSMADGYKDIYAKDYGKNWAFTIDSVNIGCEMNLPVVFVKGDDFAYGLTGASAKAVDRSIDGIWRDNPDIKGTKINLSPFIDLALSYCS